MIASIHSDFFGGLPKTHYSICPSTAVLVTVFCTKSAMVFSTPFVIRFSEEQ
jgi:hypothetical protein